MSKGNKLFSRRRERVRSFLRKRNTDRLRLSVHRSANHIYAQVIDDTAGKTLVSASTMEKDLRSKAGGNVAAAAEVGKLIGERAKKAGIDEVYFDRGGYLYHGRVKALADGAREAGLKF
jgi:large subunit ribosomal protein L18